MTSAISQILKRLMFERQIRTTELARRIGLKQPTVHRIVEGASTRPHISTLKPLADFFSITVDQLRGVEPLPWLDLHGALSPGSEPFKMVPILNWSDVADWVRSEEIDQTLNRDIVVVNKQLSEKSFALVMDDSSMNPRFPVGTKLIFDPLKEPRDRGFVVVALKDHPKVIFRQLLVDGKQCYIKPLSPDLEHFKVMRLSEEDKVCGILVQARLDYEE